MSSKKIGYVRVSSSTQNTARQEVLMQELGVNEIYIEKQSGKNILDRPQLKAMLDNLNEGDTLIVESISRFARNTKDLLELIELLKEKGVAFISKKENIDTNTPAGMFVLTIFGAISQLEREYIRDRQMEGVRIAKAEGKYKGRKKIEHKNFPAVYKKWESGIISATEAMRLLDMKPNTFYRRVKEYSSGK